MYISSTVKYNNNFIDNTIHSKLGYLGQNITGAWKKNMPSI